MIKFDISIGILSFKRTDLLLDSLKCLLGSSFNIELLVLNNNDFCIYNDIQSLINSDQGITLKYLHTGHNLGVSSGRRLLVDEASSDYMILLDDDIYLNNIDLIIKNTIDVFNNEKDVSLLAFNIKEYSTKQHNRYEIPHKNKSLDMSKDFYTYLIIGAANALRVSVVKTVGNFPDDFGLYGFEEIDVAFRVINSGAKIKYISGNVVYHKKSPDGRFSNDYVLELYLINRCKMAKRYLKRRYFYSCLFVRSAHYLLKTKKVSNFLKILNQIIKDDTESKFGNNFYSNIKEVKGFLWF